MPAPKNPNTKAATAARRDPLGRISRPVRILASDELHTQIGQMTPAEIGEALASYLADHPRPQLPTNLPLEIDLSTLPSLLNEDIRERGTTLPCVYIVVKDDVVLYVGQTSNLQNRWIEHASRPNFKNAQVIWMLAHPDNLRDLEAHLIKALRPLIPCGGKRNFSTSKVRRELDIPVVSNGVVRGA